MKRLWIAPLLLVFAAATYASTAITVSPSDMKNGETKKLVDGNKTVTVTRNGDALDIRIEGGASTNKLTITHGADSFRIDRNDGMPRALVMPPEAVKPMIREFHFRGLGAQTWFVCPNDHTMLRVPEGKENQTYKCPLDGTTMEKRKGNALGFFFDDDGIDVDSL